MLASCLHSESLPLFFIVLHFFLHYCVGEDLHMCIMASARDLVSAELAETLVMLFFAWNATKIVQSS